MTTHIEIRKGLRKLHFARQDAPQAHEPRTHVLVEFEVATQFADGQLVSINLGLRNGVARELKGRPVLVAASRVQPAAFLYRLEGDVV
jgi:hypothetical protein